MIGASVPEIQRPFVWKAKVHNLLDSLYQGCMPGLRGCEYRAELFPEWKQFLVKMALCQTGTHGLVAIMDKREGNGRQTKQTAKEFLAVQTERKRQV